MRTGLSNRSGSGPRQHSRIADPNVKVYSGDKKSQNTHGVWASAKDEHATTDSQRNLGRESDEEAWPMGTVGATKEVDVNSRQDSL